MNTPTPVVSIHYPENDGQPMSDNTEQFFWIQVLEGNLELLFRARDDVFVGGNLLWYPVEGFDKVRCAPDAFVVFGRPKGRRGSYLQWEEGNIPLTVVVEVRSPGDSDRKMRKKLKFYDEHGVSEYYLFDPGTPAAAGPLPATPPRHKLETYVRRADQLGPQRLVGGCFTSPLLGIRFDLTGDEMVVYLPNQRRFLTFPELETERLAAVQERDAVRAKLKRLAELSRKARLGQASPDELAELDRLEADAT